jgi:hypothetical protein
MKKFFIVLLTISVFSSCRKKHCSDSDLVNVPIDEEMKKYFLPYPTRETRLIFSNIKGQDTLYVSTEKEEKDTVTIYPACYIFTRQEVIFRGKSFLDTTIFLSMASYAVGTSVNVSDLTNHTSQKKPFFGLCYDRSPKSYCNGGNQRILDSLKVNNTTYYKVLEFLNSDNQGLYFAPNKGLIRWVNQNKFYDLKN